MSANNALTLDASLIGALEVVMRRGMDRALTDWRSDQDDENKTALATTLCGLGLAVVNAIEHGRGVTFRYPDDASLGVDLSLDLLREEVALWIAYYDGSSDSTVLQSNREFPFVDYHSDATFGEVGMARLDVTLKHLDAWFKAELDLP